MAQIAVRDFPPLVRAQITQEADGETMTPSNMQLVVTLLARLGAAHGLRQVPFTLEDIAMLTQALVLENALTTLHTDAVIGAFHVDDPATGRARVLGAALQQWLTAVLAAPGRPPPPAAAPRGAGGSPSAQRWPTTAARSKDWRGFVRSGQAAEDALG